MDRWKRAELVVRNLSSTRNIMAAFVVAALLAAIPLWIWQPLGIGVFLIVFVIALVGAAADPSRSLYCPSCSKRVKIGASTCHHCGREIAPS